MNAFLALILKEGGTEWATLGWWTHQLFLPLTLAKAYNLHGSFHCFLRFQYCFQGPVARLTGWTPWIVFVICSFAIASWAGNSGSQWPNPTSPALSKQDDKYFLLTNILQAFGFLIPLNGRGCWGAARMKPPLALGTACAAERFCWHGFCWVLMLGP